MPEKRSQRVQVIVELAKRAEELVAGQFEQAKGKLLKEQKQLADLEQYYQDYNHYFSRNNVGLTRESIMQSRKLLQQLVDAKENQKLQIKNAELFVEEKKQLWNQHHLRYESLKSLTNRYRKEEDIEMDKKEQRMLDDWFNQIQGTKNK